MLPERDVGCHRTGFTKTCFECVVEHKCRLWEHLIGHDPQTGQPIDRYGCADAWRNMLVIESSQQQRQTAAAVESFRNEMVKANNMALALQAQKQEQPKLIDITPEHDS